MTALAGLDVSRCQLTPREMALIEQALRENHIDLGTKIDIFPFEGENTGSEIVELDSQGIPMEAFEIAGTNFDILVFYAGTEEKIYCVSWHEEVEH